MTEPLQKTISSEPLKTSELLEEMITEKPEEEEDDYLTVGELMHSLHARGFGILIIAFALPSCFPGLLPPLPTLFAIPLAFFSVQMIMRRDEPYLPGRIHRIKIKRKSLQKVIRKSLPFVHKIETFVKPRMHFHEGKNAERMIGVFLLILACSIAIPLPFTNFVPSVAMVIMGIGILSRDGVFVLVGIPTGIAGVFIAYLFIVEGTKLLMEWGLAG